MEKMCGKVHGKLLGENSTGEGNMVRRRLTESLWLFALGTYVFYP